MTLAMRAERIGKRYTINEGSPGTLSVREQLARGVDRLLGRKPVAPPAPDPEQDQARPGQFWALRDVSFDVEAGERIGIIGANGAGKSTLLKILSRVTMPTEGRVEIRGRVASLLEVGTGFHPELTGRENIFLNGAILGMRRQEIRRKFDQIVDFSGVGRFIDTPVKHYSSGMYVRLAFSVSAWLDPDILIVDEVLAVGDQAFQKRSAERIRELTKEGRTVIFVSHSMGTVNQMCQKALYLEHGRMLSYGPVEETTVEYQRDVVAETEENKGPWHRAQFDGTEPNLEVFSYKPSEIVCRGGEGRTIDGEIHPFFAITDTIAIRLYYEVLGEVAGPLIANFHFYTEFGDRAFVAYPEQPASNQRGLQFAEVLIDPFVLNVGRYEIGLALSDYGLKEPVYIDARSAIRIEITEEAQSDMRRHGWEGPIPGVTRPRLRFRSGPAQ